MRIGSQTGSFVNHLHARGTIGQPTPVTGMGATILHWTDRTAATIFRVFEHKSLVAVETRDDNSTVVSGSIHDGSAAYKHKTCVCGYRRYFIFKDGLWREAGVTSTTGQPLTLKLGTKGSGHGLRIGARDAYSDPSF